MNLTQWFLVVLAIYPTTLYMTQIAIKHRLYALEYHSFLLNICFISKSLKTFLYIMSLFFVFICITTLQIMLCQPRFLFVLFLTE